MLSLFKKKQNYDLSWLGADMHSHLIPGIDDGCPDTDTSIACIHGLQELGLHSFFMTPHIYAEIHPNSPETIRPAYQKLRQAMDAEGMHNVKTAAAAEYMIDDAFAANYQQGAEMMTLPKRQVLIEMSYQFERKDLNEHIFQLQLHEYQPILAHPERYNYYHSSPQTYTRLKERGFRFQLNLLSLSGYYGEPVRKMAQHLVKEKMIDYIGTDLHHFRHLKALQEFVRNNDLHKMLKGCDLQNNYLV